MREGYALFVDYEFCSGCRSCEIACRNEHDFAPDRFGIRVLEDRPWQLDDGTWNWHYIPVPSQLCDYCEDRLAKGQSPSCVQHCQAKVIEFGTYEELSFRLAEKRQTMIFRP